MLTVASSGSTVKFSLHNAILAYLAPAVLVGVSGIQISLAQTQRLMAWKGGGFGMFSTVDRLGARFPRVYLLTDDGSFTAELPANLRRLAEETSAIPSSGRLSGLARRLGRQTWLPKDLVPEREGSNLPNARFTASAEEAFAISSSVGRFRVAERHEQPNAETALALAGVRVEAWTTASSRSRTHSRPTSWPRRRSRCRQSENSVKRPLRTGG